MSSVSSLETTAASDESTSSADSACSSDHIQRSINSRGPGNSFNNFLKPVRRGKSEPIAKLPRPTCDRRVVCRCRACGGERIVSRSTRYRHLRIEAEIAEDDAKWEARWSFSTAAQYQC